MLASGSILFLLGLSFLLPIGIPLTLPFLVIGLAYAVVPISLWPLIGEYIPEEELGSANGFMTSCQNLTIVLCLICAGFLMDHGVPDRNIPILFVIMATIQVIVVLLIVKRRHSDPLVKVQAQNIS